VVTIPDVSYPNQPTSTPPLNSIAATQQARYLHLPRHLLTALAEFLYKRSPPRPEFMIFFSFLPSLDVRGAKLSHAFHDRSSRFPAWGEGNPPLHSGDFTTLSSSMIRSSAGSPRVIFGFPIALLGQRLLCLVLLLGRFFLALHAPWAIRFHPTLCFHCLRRLMCWGEEDEFVATGSGL
jgi:hypothetical protein